MKVISSLRLLVFISTVSGSFVSAFADDSSKPVVSDSFALTATRTAGSALEATMTEVGGGLWTTGGGKIVFRPDGGITVADAGGAATAVTNLTSYDASKPIKVCADINPTGSGHVSLALLSGVSPGDYWKNVMLFLTVGPTGNLEAFSDKVANHLFLVESNDYAFKPNDFNHVELTYDPKSQSVSVSVNGKEVKTKVPVITPPAEVISDIAVHFNEDITANVPAVKNFQVFAGP